MLSKETETYAVVIKRTPLNRKNYQVELGDAKGKVSVLTVHEETVLAYRLVVGKELDKKTFEALENIAGYEKAYSYALGILGRRLYTEKELRRKLYERETADHVAHDVVLKLIQMGLLNDKAYATLYIESQIEMGKKSRRRIISDLQAKGIATTLINELEQLFNKESERQLMVKEIEQAYRRYSRKDLNDFELRNKVVQALGRKGFDLYEVQRQYGFFIEDLTMGD